MTRTALALVALVLLATPALAQDAPSEPVAVAPAPSTPVMQRSAELLIRHADDLGPSYKLESVQYSMGSQVVGNRTSFATKRNERRIPTDGPSASVLSGPRELTVQAVIRGVGAGQFSYLNRYRIVVTGTCELDMISGATTAVDVRITRDAGPFAEFEDGLDIACENIRLR